MQVRPLALRPMTNGLQGKVALITGAGQGVGQGIAYALAAEGVAIAAVGRTRDKLDATCAEVRRRGGRAHAFVCDVTASEQIEDCVDEVVARLGGVQILVNGHEPQTSGAAR